jgi:predicted RNase H-like nuclease
MPPSENRTKRIWRVLLSSAAARQTITYGELATAADSAPARGMGRYLNQIKEHCSASGLPPLHILAVNKRSGMPGKGLPLVDFRGDRDRVFAFNWSGLVPPTSEDFAATPGGVQVSLREPRDLSASMTVVGADVTRGRWATVVLLGGRFDRAFVASNLDELSRQVPDAAVIAIDIPIGLASGAGDWPRPCDPAARKFVGPRSSSVFTAPPRPVLDTSSYDDANELHRRLTGKGISQQSWALRAKILEVDDFIRRHPELTVIEVHPEVSFCSLKGGPLNDPKKTRDGEAVRRRLLADAGVVLPPDLPEPVRKIPHDDLLDAAVAAWSARRFAAGDAELLGAPNPRPGAETRAVIWY